MKWRKFITTLLLFLSVSSVYAIYDRELEIISVNIKREGNNVNIVFKAKAGKKMLEKDYKFIMTPVIESGLNKVRLKPFIIESKKTRALDKRFRNSHGVEKTPDHEYIKVMIGDTLSYKYTIDYEPWMNGSDMRLERILEGCCSEKMYTSLLLRNNISLVPEIINQLQPIEETTYSEAIEQNISVVKKPEIIKKEMGIEFRTGQDKIDPAYSENKTVLDEIIKEINNLKQTPGIKLNNLRITGYASPEGPQAINMKLAENRALALKDYIQTNAPSLQEDLFEIINGGENWETLRRLVEESDMEYKRDILYIIDNVPVEINYATDTSRKKSLMDLKAGKPFLYMYEHFYPQLRHACYIEIYYENLSQVSTPTNIFNHAISLVKQEKYQEAITLLLPHKEDQQAWAALGASYLMLNNYAEALYYLQKASDAGDESARRTLSQFTIKFENQ